MSGEEQIDGKDEIVERSPKGRFFRFNEELGFGAYKTVYKGYDNDSGCEIAWNVIRLQGQSQAEKIKISEEIYLLQNLNHQNIIHFIQAWINKSKNQVIFITECLSGGSLKRYIDRIKKPRLKIIKKWCKQILEGLQYLHKQMPHPIIHRDIKCENIFINTANNEIRIGDLGLALTLKTDFTTSVLGTPEFMAPEIYDQKYGTSADIYSFGMCLLEMSTGQTPYFECTTPGQVYKKVIDKTYPKSLQLIQNNELKQFILKCISDHSIRPSATQLIQDEFFNESEIDNFPVQLSPDKQIEKPSQIILPAEINILSQQKSQPQISSKKESQTNQNSLQEAIDLLHQSKLKQQQQKLDDQNKNNTQIQLNEEKQQNFSPKQNKQISPSPKQNESEKKLQQIIPLAVNSPKKCEEVKGINEENSEQSKQQLQQQLQEQQQKQQLQEEQKKQSIHRFQSNIQSSQENSSQSQIIPIVQEKQKQNQETNYQSPIKDNNVTTNIDQDLCSDGIQSPLSLDNCKNDQNQQGIVPFSNGYNNNTDNNNSFTIASNNHNGHNFNIAAASLSTISNRRSDISDNGSFQTHFSKTPISNQLSRQKSRSYDQSQGDSMPPMQNDIVQYSNKSHYQNTNIDQSSTNQNQSTANHNDHSQISLVSSKSSLDQMSISQQLSRHSSGKILKEVENKKEEELYLQCNIPGLSKAGSAIESSDIYEERLSNELIQQGPPYRLEVFEEIELKNQRFQIKLQFSSNSRHCTFEINNSKENFTKESVLKFAEQKAQEFNIPHLSQQFQFDLYNIVCEKYNQFHQKISLSPNSLSKQQKNESTEISFPGASNEFNVMEIFIKHYQNYISEIQKYLKIEGANNLKIRQQKEQIYLHRFHLNQQESQLDYQLLQSQLEKQSISKENSRIKIDQIYTKFKQQSSNNYNSPKANYQVEIPIELRSPQTAVFNQEGEIQSQQSNNNISQQQTNKNHNNQDNLINTPKNKISSQVPQIYSPKQHFTIQDEQKEFLSPPKVNEVRIYQRNNHRVQTQVQVNQTGKPDHLNHSHTISSSQILNIKEQNQYGIQNNNGIHQNLIEEKQQLQQQHSNQFQQQLIVSPKIQNVQKLICKQNKQQYLSEDQLAPSFQQQQFQQQQLQCSPIQDILKQQQQENQQQQQQQQQLQSPKMQNKMIKPYSNDNLPQFSQLQHQSQFAQSAKNKKKQADQDLQQQYSSKQVPQKNSDYENCDYYSQKLLKQREGDYQPVQFQQQQSFQAQQKNEQSQSQNQSQELNQQQQKLNSSPNNFIFSSLDINLQSTSPIPQLALDKQNSSKQQSPLVLPLINLQKQVSLSKQGSYPEVSQYTNPNQQINFVQKTTFPQQNQQQVTNNSQSINGGSKPFGFQIPLNNNSIQGEQKISIGQYQISKAQSGKSSPPNKEDEIKKIISDAKSVNLKGRKIDIFNVEKSNDEAEIKLLQKCLKLLMPLEQIQENGIFGNYTESMIKQYKKQYSLQPNEVIDSDLWRSISYQLEKTFGFIEKKEGLTILKDNAKKQIFKDAQSQQSKEAMIMFESKLNSEFGLQKNHM